MKVFEFTHPGRRDENQDYAIHKFLNDSVSVFVVCDGMGGYSNGGIAAHTVADAIVDYIDTHISELNCSSLLKSALNYANEELYVKRLSLGCKEMGCVVACLLISDMTAYMVWLGDSRIYAFRGTKEIFRSEDHSLLNDIKKIRTLDQAEYEKYASIVTKGIMGTETMDSMEIYMMAIKSEDVLCLCSDGLHKGMNVEDLLNYGDEQLQSYLEKESKNSEDNVTFIKIVV